MKKTIILVCVCVLALPMIARSQGQGGIETTPWWDRPVVRNLGLSADQLGQLRAIVRASRDRLIQLRATIASAEGALADEMSADAVDMARAEAAIDRVVSARGDLMRAISQMSLKLRQVLTPAQWQELKRRGAQRVRAAVVRRLRGRANN